MPKTLDIWHSECDGICFYGGRDESLESWEALAAAFRSEIHYGTAKRAAVLLRWIKSDANLSKRQCLEYYGHLDDVLETELTDLL